jgi:hypothetical protein
MKNQDVACKIKAQISLFSGFLSEGLANPKRKFIHCMLYGIQASKDIKLSCITRALGENIPLIKTENRLSRHINDGDITDFINNKLSEKGSKWIEEDTVIALDLSDISKEYSEKQENLALVRDGSTGEIKEGWHLIEAIGANIREEKVVPLYGELYSSDEVMSENAMLLKAVDTVRSKTGNKGIWVIDRGGDRKRLYEGLIKRKGKFVIRLTGKRALRKEDNSLAISLDIALKCPCKYKTKINIRGEVFKEKMLYIGWVKARFSFHNIPVVMVVIKGYGELPLMLITDLEVNNEADALHILEIYLTRWKCEESWRFIKQSYNLEDIRLMKYVGLRNTVALLTAVFFFISVILGAGMKLWILLKKIYERAKRFFEIPPFKQYAICDGIYSILFGKKLSPPQKSNEPIAQLILPLDIFR